MQIQIQRIIVAWSEDDIKAWRKGDRVIPLTAEAFIAARHLDEGDLLDAVTCIACPHEVDGEAVELLNTLHETLKSSRFPWQEAYANVIFEIKAFQLLTWLTLIRSLRRQFDPTRIDIVPPRVFSTHMPVAEGFIYRLARQSFSVAQKVLEREGVLFVTAPAATESRPLRKHPLVRRAIAKGAAGLLNRGFAKVLLKRKMGEEILPLPAGDCDVVLVGQQYGDAFHSAPLAARLANKYGKRFLWVSMRPHPAPDMTAEESALIANLDCAQVRFIDSATLLTSATTNPAKAALLDFGSAWQIAGLLAPRKEWGLNHGEWFDFLMDPDLRGFASRYQAWEGVLSTLRPNVAVGLSVLQDMALVRAWTRRNGVPFVCFMHGAFYALKYSHDVDADYIGVFGRTLVEQLKKSNLPQPRGVLPCGSMQFGDKVRSSFRRQREGETASSSDTVTFSWLF